MNNKELVAAVKDIATNYNTLYVMGCFGAPIITEPFDNVSRYCENHEYNMQASRTKMIKAAADKSPVVFGFDCVCLIKAVLWGWSGDASKRYGGATYASNNVPDIGADQMITKCKDVSTDFSNVEIGEALWTSGHIGVYIGNGLAVECTPAWKNKVQITAVRNIGTKTGYNARIWKKHGKLPYVTYVSTTEPVVPKPAKSITQIAAEVIEGKYGNGTERKAKVMAEGYNYNLVQAEVNRQLKASALTAVALDVLEGKYGNGATRKRKLKKAGHNYAEVQAEVNRIIKKMKS